MVLQQTLTERLSTGRPVLLDGALNTELSGQGLLFNTQEWLMVNLASPEVIAKIHRDYARAGAELHIANSFATGRHVLEAAGLGAKFEDLNRAAVQLCRDAVDGAAPHQQWIAGSISTFAPDHDRNNLPDHETLERNVRDQALLLADAGCDMICLEMLFDVDSSIAMVKGAVACGLPISLGLVCAREPNGDMVLEGSRRIRRGIENTPLRVALEAILGAAPKSVTLIVSVMHSELEHTGPALEVVRQLWDGDTAAYPNIGRYAPPGSWDTSAGHCPAEFADACETWVRQGAKIVGGCCGVGPAHIRELCRRRAEAAGP